MNSDHATHEAAIAQLEKKLDRVAQLESELGTKGVNFAVRGQEDITADVSVISLREPLNAADAVIRMLEMAKVVVSDKAALSKEARGLPAF